MAGTPRSHSFARVLSCLASLVMSGPRRSKRRKTGEHAVSPGDESGLGPFLGSLPSDVLQQVVLPKLKRTTSLPYFARAAGACWRAVKDAGLDTSFTHPADIFLAVRNGQLKRVKYLLETVGLPMMRNDARHVSGAPEKKLRILRKLDVHGCPFEEIACALAAKFGRLDCLRFLLENGCECTSVLSEEAARHGRLNILRYLRDVGCPWTDETCAGAARGGHLECLRYLRENGCPWTEDTCVEAARGGHLECLRYLHENGCPWNDSASVEAARGGHLECLRYLQENGCPWSQKTLLCAAAYSMECLRFMRANGCELTHENLTWIAAFRGKLDCLRYLRENGAPLTSRACGAAVAAGHLDCLRYMHENGSPWDEETFTFTEIFTRPQIVEEQYRSGWEELMESFAPDIERARAECMRYARDNGCACPPEYQDV